MERQQKVKGSTVSVPASKRENELSQAFTAYNTRIASRREAVCCRHPGTEKHPAGGDRIGTAYPVVVIFLRENMNTKIRGRKDLEGVAVPFIGEIPLFALKKGLFRDKRPMKPSCSGIINGFSGAAPI